MGGTLLVYGKLTDHHHIFIFFLTQLVSWTVFFGISKTECVLKTKEKALSDGFKQIFLRQFVEK